VQYIQVGSAVGYQTILDWLHHSAERVFMQTQPLYRVLVVEADLATRTYLLQLLESFEYRATGVSSIAETLAQENLSDFRAFLLDWNLPDGTADELLARLHSRAPDAASIIVTGDADINASIAALRHGADDYLVKPIHPHCLQASLARIDRLQDCKKKFALCERLATIGEVVTNVAHESRNALQRIQAQADLMELDLATDPEKMHGLEVIKSASHSLLCMFDELREFAAPIVLNNENCQLRELVDRAWRSLTTIAEAHFATLSCNFADVELSVDACRMEQVFRNLFENALAACPSPARIVVSWSMQSHAELNSIHISVCDNGPGFSDEQRERAFEPFYTTKRKGTGLGLPICRRIVKEHQGWLDIRPRTGEPGACLELVLPLSPKPIRPKKLSHATHELV
jgi:signal transduction histidine kinase